MIISLINIVLSRCRNINVVLVVVNLKPSIQEQKKSVNISVCRPHAWSITDHYASNTDTEDPGVSLEYYSLFRQSFNNITFC